MWVGMDFPANILPSLYCREEFLALLVRELLTLLIRQQYKLIALVNGHGARNHLDTLQRLAAEFSASGPARVILATAWPSKGRPGHLYRACRRWRDVGDDGPVPDSVDVTALPPTSEPLRSQDWAIVDADTFNGQPTASHTLRQNTTRDQVHTGKGSTDTDVGREDVESAVREAMAAWYSLIAPSTRETGPGSFVVPAVRRPSCPDMHTTSEANHTASFSRRSNCALMATMTVLSDMSNAPSAGDSRMPIGANTPQLMAAR